MLTHLGHALESESLANNGTSTSVPEDPSQKTVLLQPFFFFF